MFHFGKLFSTVTGKWSEDNVRTDLPYGRVSYTPGDFNGDGKTDVVVSDFSGSYWCYSRGRGAWGEGYRRLDLTTQMVDLVACQRVERAWVRT